MKTEIYTDCDNCISDGCDYLSDTCKCFRVGFIGGKPIGIKLLNNTLDESQKEDLLKDLIIMEDMWSKIEETVDRAVSGIVYSIWGSVGFRTSYNKEEKSMNLIIWDKSYRCDDKKEIVNKKFKIDLSISENKAIHDLIFEIEKYLLESYS